MNVGDPITPPPSTVRVPRLRGGEIVVRGYPLAMVHAEKTVTALARGTANTRWRDFADLYLLSRHLPVDATELTTPIRRVATHRQVELQPLAQVLERYGEIGQQRWTAWRRKQRLEDQLPAGFAVVVEAVVAFGEPVIAGEAKGFVWIRRQASGAESEDRWTEATSNVAPILSAAREWGLAMGLHRLR